MNELENLKQKLLQKTPSAIDESYTYSIYLVMEKVHLSYEEIKELPLPTFIELLKCIHQEAKEESKRMKTKGMQRHKK